MGKYSELPITHTPKDFAGAFFGRQAPINAHFQERHQLLIGLSGNLMLVATGSTGQRWASCGRTPPLTGPEPGPVRFITQAGEEEAHYLCHVCRWHAAGLLQVGGTDE